MVTIQTYEDVISENDKSIMKSYYLSFITMNPSMNWHSNMSSHQDSLQQHRKLTHIEPKIWHPELEFKFILDVAAMGLAFM